MNQGQQDLDNYWFKKEQRYFNGSLQQQDFSNPWKCGVGKELKA